MFKEEVEYLQNKLPFRCAHGLEISDFQSGTFATGPALFTPRPGYPVRHLSQDVRHSNRRLAALSTRTSTVDPVRIAAKYNEVEMLFYNLVNAVRSCTLGEIVGYEELENKGMVEYLEWFEEEVDALHDKVGDDMT